MLGFIELAGGDEGLGGERAQPDRSDCLVGASEGFFGLAGVVEGGLGKVTGTPFRYSLLCSPPLLSKALPEC